MFRGLIPGLNSLHSSEDEPLGRVPATFLNLVHQYRHRVNLSRPEPSNSGVSPVSRTLFYLYTAGFGLILLLASIACSLNSKKRKEKETSESCTVTPTIIEATGLLPGSNVEEMTWSSLNDAFFHESKTVTVSESDANYAEELQIQEALLASLLTSQLDSTASSSSIQARPTLSALLKNPGKEVAEPSQSFCEICLENKETWQMYRNSNCSHSFCYDCTSKHITAKIEDNIKTVTCPGLNCKVVLDSDECRLMVTKDIVIQWDETLCKSMILESQKLYCPFRDCSALLVNDYQGVTKKTDCPVCKRPFCATCLVPWHSEFTCREFEKLNAKKKGKEDNMAEALAKKKMWRKCPRCKFFVEKTEGCLHITCRCKYEFCYRCGSKWSSSHGGCRPKS